MKFQIRAVNRESSTSPIARAVLTEHHYLPVSAHSARVLLISPFMQQCVCYLYMLCCADLSIGTTADQGRKQQAAQGSRQSQTRGEVNGGQCVMTGLSEMYGMWHYSANVSILFSRTIRPCCVSSILFLCVCYIRFRPFDGTDKK